MIFKSTDVTHIRFGDGDIIHQPYLDDDNNPILCLHHTKYGKKPGSRIVEFPEDVDLDKPDVIMSFKSIRDIDRFISYLKQLRKGAVEEQKHDNSTDESSGSRRLSQQSLED